MLLRLSRYSSLCHRLHVSDSVSLLHSFTVLSLGMGLMALLPFIRKRGYDVMSRNMESEVVIFMAVIPLTDQLTLSFKEHHSLHVFFHGLMQLFGSWFDVTGTNLEAEMK